VDAQDQKSLIKRRERRAEREGGIRHSLGRGKGNEGKSLGGGVEWPRKSQGKGKLTSF